MSVLWTEEWETIVRWRRERRRERPACFSTLFALVARILELLEALVRLQ